MEVLSGFEPHAPFTFFEEITALPRGSHNEGKIGSYLLDFAAARGLEAHQDAAGNVIIVREATPGHEQAEPLILQAHMDMVCDQEPWSTKDMSVEGVDLLVEGDTITADGTTLGADDGAGIAYILAVLDDSTLVHPRLEAVSIGPDITNVHTPNERLSISSFASCYRLLQAVIEELA